MEVPPSHGSAAQPGPPSSGFRSKNLHLHLNCPDGRIKLSGSLLTAAVLGPKYSYTQDCSHRCSVSVFRNIQIKDKSNCILWTINTNLYQRFGTKHFQNQILINVFFETHLKHYGHFALS